MEPILLGVSVNVRRFSLGRTMVGQALCELITDVPAPVFGMTAEREETHLAELRTRGAFLVLAVTGQRERIARVRDIVAVHSVAGGQPELVLRDGTSCRLPCRVIDPVGEPLAALLRERLGLCGNRRASAMVGR